MKHRHELSAGAHVFIIEAHSDPQHTDQAARAFVELNVYREDKPGESWHWEGYLLPAMDVEFELSYPDQANIKGHLSARQSSGKDHDTVWLNAHFGADPARHFEGGLITI